MSEAVLPPEAKSRIHYRLVRESDFPIIKEMYALLNQHFYSLGYHLPHPPDVGQAWLDSFQRTLGRFSNVWIAELAGETPGVENGDLGNEVLGFILCRIKRVPQYMGGVLVGELSDMWIVPKARRLGIGKRLSHLALKWLKEQQVHSVEIQVLNPNDASWKLYEGMGFQLEFRVARLLWEDYVESPAEESAN